MNIHEYQGKAVLKNFGVTVSAGAAAFTVEEAITAAKSLPGPVYVVKSQIHAGGRGKGKFKELPADAKGGVRLAKSVDEVAAFAREMLGRTLVTVQTGPAGKQVNRLYVEDGSDIERNSICRCWWIAKPRASPTSSPPKAAWISKRWRTIRRTRS
jgi:succinyl-CoA synthetase beta subunit